MAATNVTVNACHDSTATLGLTFLRRALRFRHRRPPISGALRIVIASASASPNSPRDRRYLFSPSLLACFREPSATARSVRSWAVSWTACWRSTSHSRHRSSISARHPYGFVGILLRCACPAYFGQPISVTARRGRRIGPPLRRLQLSGRFHR